MTGPERRYLPTPYRGNVEATLEYRSGYEQGYDFAKRRGLIGAIESWYNNQAWCNDSPRQIGFEDGARAWFVRLRKIQQTDLHRPVDDRATPSPPQPTEAPY